MIIQGNLFNPEELEQITLGSKLWRKHKYQELINKTWDELKSIENKVLGSKNPVDIYTFYVLVDVYHYGRYEEFKSHYPKITFGNVQRPCYLD